GNRINTDKHRSDFPANLCSSVPIRGFVLTPRQMPILDSMRLIGGRAESRVSVSLVLRIVPIEPDNITISFEREYVSRDAIEKPPVVAYHNRATREILERGFKRAECVYIQVVGRLI